MQLFKAVINEEWTAPRNDNQETPFHCALSLYSNVAQLPISTTQQFKGMCNHGLQHKPTGFRSGFGF